MPAEDASSAEVSKTQTQAPLPTLQDIPALTPESDFKPYLNQGVEPHVRNAAMKKLFTDPRYNVMDRLDTYIDALTFAPGRIMPRSIAFLRIASILIPPPSSLTVIMISDASRVKLN